MDGSATQESVLNDPVVVEWMANLPRTTTTGRSKPRLWGWTREVGMLSTIVDAQVGKAVMKRPDIPGEKMREKNNQNKLKSTLSRIGVT
jgi:hypothetical protein